LKNAGVTLARSVKNKRGDFDEGMLVREEIGAIGEWSEM
jgi:hypothetical protein